jgi:phage terminase large subunit-like protein
VPRRRADDKVTAADVIEFIETCLFIPEGQHVGKPLKLQPWQKDWIGTVYDNEAGTRRAILSTGRKCGKTTLSAALLLAHLVGPPARNRPNSQLYSAAQSRDQAAIIFSLASKMVRLNPDLRSAIVIQETAKSLACSELGTRYRALSAEATTAYGLSPALTIFDELGVVRGPRSPLFEALETATAAQAEPLTIIISTQAPSDGDLLSILIDDALANHDPRTICKLFTASTELDPFDEATIRIANPAFDLMNARELLAMANDARRMPARESEYRNLILNQRVEATNPFIAPSVWAACGTPAAPLEGVQVYAGLDLSSTQDLTALVLIGWSAGKWHVHPTFWLPLEGLETKAAADRVPYDLWHSQGFLQATPGRTVSYEYVSHHLRELFQRYDIQKIGFDRWNMRHLRPWLLRAGFHEQQIEDHFVEFGQGMASMSPALRDLEQVLLESELAHGGHPVLSMNVANTVIVLDDAGNRKPSKRKSTGRIDGLVALAMAIGVAPLQVEQIDAQLNRVTRIMTKRRETAREQRARHWAEVRRQWVFEKRQKLLAVIAEFGGEKREYLLVPEDDPVNNEVMLRLADEVLFLRNQLSQLARAVGYVQEHKPIMLLAPGPYASTDVEVPAPAA